MRNIFEKFLEKIEEKKSIVCVGIDPDINDSQFPIDSLARVDDGVFYKSKYDGSIKKDFAKQLIDAVHDLVPVIKPNTRFFRPDEAHILREIVIYAHKKGLLVIGDCKENDIGNTMRNAYENQFGFFDFDAITVNGYFGSDGVVNNHIFDRWWKQGKGLFILARTSNPSSEATQECRVLDLKKEEVPYYTLMVNLISQWNADYENSIGLVAGATNPSQLEGIASAFNGLVLAPGYGAQGGTASSIRKILEILGKPRILVNSSRGIMYAYMRRFKGKFDASQFAVAARKEVETINQEFEVQLRRFFR